MEAQTTEEDEQRLSDYFCSHDDIPSEWADYAIMFRGLKAADRLVRSETHSCRHWLVGVAASLLFIALGCAAYFVTAEDEPHVALRAASGETPTENGCHQPAVSGGIAKASPPHVTRQEDKAEAHQPDRREAARNAVAATETNIVETSVETNTSGQKAEAATYDAPSDEALQMVETMLMNAMLQQRLSQEIVEEIVNNVVDDRQITHRL